MRLIEAIALSPANKAQTYNDNGKMVLVQERYDSDKRWWHIWLLKGQGEVAEIESRIGSDAIKAFDVDWQADYRKPAQKAPAFQPGDEWAFLFGWIGRRGYTTTSHSH